MCVCVCEFSSITVWCLFCLQLVHAPRVKPATRSSSVPRATRPPPEGAGGACGSKDSYGYPRGAANRWTRASADRGSAEPGEEGSWTTLDPGRPCVECVSCVETLMEEAQRILTAGHFNTNVRASSSLLA